MEMKVMNWVQNWMADVFPSYFSRLMLARGGGVGVGVEVWLWTGTLIGTGDWYVAGAGGMKICCPVICCPVTDVWCSGREWCWAGNCCDEEGMICW